MLINKACRNSQAIYLLGLTKNHFVLKLIVSQSRGYRLNLNKKFTGFSKTFHDVFK